MAREDLSPEEIERLYKICLIPMLSVFLIILIYFNYLMYTNPLKTRWDFLTEIGLPLFVLFPVSGMVTFEILYHRKVKSPLKFHLKRFLGRLFLLLLSGLWFFGVLIVLEPVLSPIVGDRDFLVSFILATIVYALVILKLKEFVNRLDKGEWQC
jgi:hypothetical protein